MLWINDSVQNELSFFFSFIKIKRKEFDCLSEISNLFMDMICETLFTEVSWIDLVYKGLLQCLKGLLKSLLCFPVVWPGMSGFSSWSKLSQSVYTLSEKQNQASTDFSSSNVQFKTAHVWTNAGKLIEAEQ